MKKLIVVLAAGVLLGMFQLGFAQPEGPAMGKRFAKMLDLTGEQTQKIEDLRLQMQKDILPLQSQVQQKRTDLKLLLTADSPDQSKINKTIDDISQIRSQMQKIRVKQQMAVRSLLNAEQKKKFDAMILSHPGPGRAGMRRMHDRGMEMRKGRMPHPGVPMQQPMEK